MSISQRNSSNASFYERHEQRSSLLCHPAGLELLRSYASLKKKGSDNDLDSSLCTVLAKKLAPVVREQETCISSTIIEVINDEWHQSQEEHSSVSGEAAEAVRGHLGKAETSGKPDGVVRLTSLYDTKHLKVQLIIEVSVDNNGGEKKIGQAFEYASLIQDQSKTALLFTFHVHRNKSKINIVGKPNLKITQEAFIYLHSETENERKMGFLWREVYEQAKESDVEFLFKSSGGLVRCLDCAQVNRDTEVIFSDINSPLQWEVVSDNAVISGGDYVYKIFDNRFYPTYRRLDQWLDNELPWIKRLGGIQTLFEFEESSGIDKIGSSEKRNCSHSQTAYPRGFIQIIKYNCVKGTHYASRASHFLHIADCISEMHEKNIVHGDIRGFNMLHPYPKDQPEIKTGICKSLLIDFDFSGKPGIDKYPPGYSVNVKDNAFCRSGKAGKEMQKVDDWKDLGSVMACYSISAESLKTLPEFLEHNTKWGEIWNIFHEDGSTGLEMLRDFIKNNNDPKIKVTASHLVGMNEIICKGTGSPNKRLQKPRGSLTVNSHTKEKF